MNRESERKRLVELLSQFERTCPDNCTGLEKSCTQCVLEQKADHLLDDGWMRPPVKVGDKVYGVFEDDVLDEEIILIEVTETATYLSTCSERYMWINGCLYSEMLDQKLYFTREDAVKAREGSEK